MTAEIVTIEFSVVTEVPDPSGIQRRLERVCGSYEEAVAYATLYCKGHPPGSFCQIWEKRKRVRS